MAIAKWNGHIIAQSADIVMVEGNVYFPLSSIKTEYFKESDVTSHCPWKGQANYYDIVIDGSVNANAAWYYTAPYKKAMQIKDHIAFWNGVEVQQ